MNIVCCLKQVPDTMQVKIDPETNTLVREGVEAILNPYDLVALELAARLSETTKGRFAAICMGPPQAQTILRQAVAIGAQRAILLSDRAFAGADTLATSYTLAKGIQKIAAGAPVDLVLVGKQAIDGDTAQTGPGIATRLKFAQLTYVAAVEGVDPAAGTIEVLRRLEHGNERVRGRLPALLTVELEAAQPRRVPLPDLMDSLRTPIEVWNAAAIGAHPSVTGIKGSPTWVRRISAPPPRQGGGRFTASTQPEEAVKEMLDTLLTDEPFAAALLDRWRG